MAGYKETPRQKMISMMYLVLTALLALNVSKQIIDAFLVVNDSMEATNANFSSKVETTYSKFEIQYQLNPNKVGPYWEKAKKAHMLSSSLQKYVDSVKYAVIQHTDRLESLEAAKKTKLRDVERIDNFDVPTSFFMGPSELLKTGVAYKLKDKIDKYRKEMLELVDPAARPYMKIGLDTKGP